MPKTLAPSQAVTTRDKKGLKFISIVEAAYNKAGLSEDEAQLVNDAPGLPEVVHGFIEANRKGRPWREQNGVVYFSVTSDGATGPQWIDRLEAKRFNVRPYAKSVLQSVDFRPTSGITTEIAVLRGTLWSDSDRVTKNIRAQAYAGTFTSGRKLTDPNAEVACLIREKFSDEEIEAMGLWGIVAMHEPINDSGGGPGLLDAHRGGGGRALGACGGRPGLGWDRECGFAFVAAQV